MDHQPILDEATAAWIEGERGIPVEIAARFGVVTVNGCPAFEYRASGLLLYRKLRISGPDGEKSFRRDRTGAATCLWGEQDIQDDPDLSSPLVICEGEIDRLSLLAAGIPNVVSVPDGAQLAEPGEGRIDPTDDKAFQWLWDGPALKSHIKRFSRVVLATDDDKKGKVLRGELSVRLDRTKCYFVTYPEGCKDANDVLLKHGVKAIGEMITKAKPIVPDRLVPVSDIMETGTGEVFPSDLSGLNHLGFAFHPPELVVITGAPGSGKSEFATYLGASLARYHKQPGVIINFEDRSTRLADTLARYAIGNVDGVNNKGEGRAWAGKWIRTVAPPHGLDELVEFDMAWVRETLIEARMRHGCTWVILDPWNEMEHMFDRSKSEAQYTNDALRGLKALARSLQIILMIVVHPSKEGGRVKDIEELDMYSIAGAAAWANKADHGFIVHRPDHAKKRVFVKLAKSKDHLVMGRPGVWSMDYEFDRVKYIHVTMGAKVDDK